MSQAQSISFRLKLHKLLVASAGLFAIVWLCVNCASDDNKTTMQFLTDNGIIGIAPARIISSQSGASIGDDYKNKIHFMMLHSSKSEFKQFCADNGFNREDVLTIPSKGSKWPKVPAWWDAPTIQPDRCSKKIGNVVVLVLWNSDKMFLYGSD